MTDNEHDLAVLRERLEDLQNMLASAEADYEEAEDAVIWMADQPQEDLEDYENALSEASDRCEWLKEEIAEVEMSIWQLENGDEEEGGEFFV